MPGAWATLSLPAWGRAGQMAPSPPQQQELCFQPHAGVGYLSSPSPASNQGDWLRLGWGLCFCVEQCQWMLVDFRAGVTLSPPACTGYRYPLHIHSLHDHTQIKTPNSLSSHYKCCPSSPLSKALDRPCCCIVSTKNVISTCIPLYYNAEFTYGESL